MKNVWIKEDKWKLSFRKRIIHEREENCKYKQFMKMNEVFDYISDYKQVNPIEYI